MLRLLAGCSCVQAVQQKEVENADIVRDAIEPSNTVSDVPDLGDKGPRSTAPAEVTLTRPRPQLMSSSLDAKESSKRDCASASTSSAVARVLELEDKESELHSLGQRDISSTAAPEPAVVASEGISRPLPVQAQPQRSSSGVGKWSSDGSSKGRWVASKPLEYSDKAPPASEEDLSPWRDRLGSASTSAFAPTAGHQQGQGQDAENDNGMGFDRLYRGFLSTLSWDAQDQPQPEPQPETKAEAEAEAAAASEEQDLDPWKDTHHPEHESFSQPQPQPQSQNEEKVGAQDETPSSSSGLARFSVGTKVEGNYRNLGQWFSGKISRDCGDDTFDVDYDDGEKERGVLQRRLRLATVPPSLIRSQVAQSSDNNNPSPHGRKDAWLQWLRIGSRVEGRLRNGSRGWSAGVVSRVREDGSFDVNYDDGRAESRVESERLRMPIAPTQRQRQTQAASASASASQELTSESTEGSSYLLLQTAQQIRTARNQRKVFEEYLNEVSGQWQDTRFYRERREGKTEATEEEKDDYDDEQDEGAAIMRQRWTDGSEQDEEWLRSNVNVGNAGGVAGCVGGAVAGCGGAMVESVAAPNSLLGGLYFGSTSTGEEL